MPRCGYGAASFAWLASAEEVPRPRKRFPATLVVAEARERKLYGTTDPERIERVLQSYRDFVALCVRKEAETGEPCLIVASY